MPESALACCRQLPGNRACCWQPREARRKHAISADRGVHGGSSKRSGPGNREGKNLSERFPAGEKGESGFAIPACRRSSPLPRVGEEPKVFLGRPPSRARVFISRDRSRAESLAPHAESRAHAVASAAPRFSLFPGRVDGIPKGKNKQSGSCVAVAAGEGGGEGIVHAEVERVSPRAPRGGSFLEAVFLFGPIHYLSASTFICGNHRDAEVSNYNVELRR